ncbi:hypothetical protein GCM10023142_14520 [Anaerocolumna aminovalerica]|jgi:hypothetical protein|uniref:DUF2933 domain-containing protein n=1 Tax=Anaerocolumna aminovalerica TaxID=1527 RepID=A0A1I5F8T2_9FIRM|nr:hypothetical protein [Anaerocolumna aminovalerica]MDU6266243.1 hypothetical protein [Anaerocolumna aminovalerica]SFO19721.1 hypothetical protein SAMN04489757_11292 [Anaerocolumna aminovalerica]
MDMKKTNPEKLDIKEEGLKSIELEKETCDNHKHSPIKHMLHMIICCGLPILILLSLPFIARFSPVAATILGFIAPFICPIMMGGMLFMMFGSHKKKNCCHNHMREESESRRF